MSKETLEWLNANTLIGYTDRRGHAWHYLAGLQSGEPNHYPGPVPVGDVERRLFGWDALERPLYVESPVTGGIDLVPDRKAIVRSDSGHVMGVFSDGYVPHPYRTWLVRNVASILDDDLGIGSAGLLRSGAVAWVSVEVPENVTTPEGVEFRPRLLATTSFDGSLATTYKRVVTNVVCDNTMAAGLAERGQQTRLWMAFLAVHCPGVATRCRVLKSVMSCQLAGQSPVRAPSLRFLLLSTTHWTVSGRA